MDIQLPEKESVGDVLSKLNTELHHERIDRYEVERHLNKLNSLEQDVIDRGFHLGRNRGILVPLMHTIQDDLYKLRGSVWRSVYLVNKRSRMDEETIRLKRELYYVEKDSGNLVTHVSEAERMIKELTPKEETVSIGAAIVLIAMSGFMFSSVQSYKIFSQPYTGLSILPSIGLVVYFIFATLLVLAMFAFLFGVRRK